MEEWVDAIRAQRKPLMAVAIALLVLLGKNQFRSSPPTGYQSQGVFQNPTSYQSQGVFQYGAIELTQLPGTVWEGNLASGGGSSIRISLEYVNGAEVSGGLSYPDHGNALYRVVGQSTPSLIEFTVSERLREGTFQLRRGTQFTMAINGRSAIVTGLDDEPLGLSRTH